MSFKDAQQSCEALGESLWGASKDFSQIKSNLAYLSYQGRYPPNQRYWISPNNKHTPQTINGKGSIDQGRTTDKFPVLCTQTAPYSTETDQDSSSELQVTVSSNNERVTGSVPLHQVRITSS